MNSLVTRYLPWVLLLFAVGMILQHLSVTTYSIIPLTRDVNGQLKMDPKIPDRSIQLRPNSSALTYSSKDGNSKSTRKSIMKPNALCNEKAIKDNISRMATKMYTAKLHVRGTKTSDSLREAIGIMETILKTLHINIDPLKDRSTVKPKSVCHEIFKGNRYGYFPAKCTYGKPLSTLVTILAYFRKSNISEITSFMKSMYAKNEQYTVLVALNETDKLSELKVAFPNAKFHMYLNIDVGEALNTLAAKFVKTPYVLIARNVELFTDDARIERLVRELESLQVSVVAGAYRTRDGHWRKGCFQSVYRNYTLKYVQGYDESLHECIFCDYLTGPFITSKQILNTYKFSNIADNQGLFEDWFLQLRQHQKEIVVCPDSMFHTNYADEATTLWGKLMKKWDLYKLITPNAQTFVMKCNKLPKWFTPGTRVSHPCFLQSCANTIKFIKRKSEANNISYEINASGTLMGGVKFGAVLPWEMDIDMPVSSSALENFKKFKKIFQREGHRVRLREKTHRDSKNVTTGGIVKLYGPHYKVDIWAEPILDPDRMIKEGFEPTKVLIDGTWVNTLRNPGMAVRNRYKDIYRHAVHYIATRTTIRSNYNTNTFLKCKTPGKHNCLDRYNPDGNLQFKDVLP